MAGRRGHHASRRDESINALGYRDGYPIGVFALRGGSVTDFIPDVHRTVELGLVTSGSFEHAGVNGIVSIRTGDVWVAGKWEPHSLRVAQPGTGCIVFSFLFDAIDEEFGPIHRWPEVLNLPGGRGFMVIRPSRRSALLRIAGEVWSELRERRFGWETLLCHSLVRILIELRRGATRGASQLPEANGGATSLERVMPALDLIVPGRGEHVSTVDAARACNMSLSRFHTHFKRAVGVSFASLALRARLRSAAHRLLTTQEPVDHIALDEGFSDPSHFYRSFRQHYGCTPGEYRAGTHRAARVNLALDHASDVWG